mgnify:CR=1 FL=1
MIAQDYAVAEAPRRARIWSHLYVQVLGVLKTHRATVERITYALAEKKSLFASDFELLLQPPKTGYL